MSKSYPESDTGGLQNVHRNVYQETALYQFPKDFATFFCKYSTVVCKPHRSYVKVLYFIQTEERQVLHATEQHDLIKKF